MTEKKTKVTLGRRLGPATGRLWWTYTFTYKGKTYYNDCCYTKWGATYAARRRFKSIVKNPVLDEVYEVYTFDISI